MATLSLRLSSALITALLLASFLLLPVLFDGLGGPKLPHRGEGELRRTYFADAAKTTVVGRWGYLCDGSVDTWGQKTAFQEEVQNPCNK